MFRNYQLERVREQRDTAAIRKASDPLLRSVLITLCERDPDIKNRALRHLQVLRVGEGPGRKRKANELSSEKQKCLRCGKMFVDDDTNYDEEPCCYHEGTLEIDPPHWRWDGWRRSTLQNPENISIYPDGCTWSCCGKPGALDGDDLYSPTKGCEYAPHESEREERLPNVYTCERCDQTYMKKDNTKESCECHPGVLELDEEAEIWYEVAEANWKRGLEDEEDEEDEEDSESEEEFDEEKAEEYWQDHPRDTQEVLDNCPGGFKWSCCEAHGDDGSDGCRPCPHVATKPRRKQTRLERERDVIDLTSD